MISLNQETKDIPYLIAKIIFLDDELEQHKKAQIQMLEIKEGSIISSIEKKGKQISFTHNEKKEIIDLKLAKQIYIEPAYKRQDFIFSGNKTKQREVILKCVMNFKNHFSLKDCLEKINKIDSQIGEITIYRTLKTLVEKKILTEIQLPKGEKRMEVIKSHHDHIICQNCDNIIEFCSPEIEDLQEKIAKENNITLSSHIMTLIASDCEKCRA